MALVPTPSGRRYSRGSFGRSAPASSTPVDPRVHLALSERDVREEVLPNGMILTTYMDPPLGAGLREAEAVSTPSSPPPEDVPEPRRSGPKADQSENPWLAYGDHSRP